MKPLHKKTFRNNITISKVLFIKSGDVFFPLELFGKIIICLHHALFDRLTNISKEVIL